MPLLTELENLSCFVLQRFRADGAAGNTARDAISKPVRNDFPKMPSVMGLEFLWKWVCYIYIAPTALGFSSKPTPWKI
jgi:hypothetical protein